MNAIVTYSKAGATLAIKLLQLGFKADIYTPESGESQTAEELAATLFEQYQCIVYIGALGICVRAIAPSIKSKKTDPAVVNIDVNGRYVQPVLSGHIGGANTVASDLSRLLGATPIITTVSDSTDRWSLDLLPGRFGWTLEPNNNLTHLMAAFVNNEPTALLLEVRDEGTRFLEATLPENVQVFYRIDDFTPSSFQVILAITPFIRPLGDNVLCFRPKVLQVGVGCQRGLSPSLFDELLTNELQRCGLSPLSIATIGSIDIKKDEEAFTSFASSHNIPFSISDGITLGHYHVPNPSERVESEVGCKGVAEASAMHLSNNELLVEKTKMVADGKHFTFAVAITRRNERKGFVEIVGAGPGDPQLVTVRGKELLQIADLILYAGSLVPKELTDYARAGCVVRSSADMDLYDQVNLMEEYYRKGLLIVRLHTGDPCIYGAIQEQMNLMDQRAMDYRITPGVSSFQAAAAALQSQFTIPEEVQTIILTRGEGRTPMPDREQLRNLARSQSTMCIYLSAAIAGKIEAELLEHYPPETPVAVCYKLTWKEEKIWRCTLATLEQTVKENNLSMTTLIVVGKAIDNRSGESKLYDKSFAHAFRGEKR